VYVSAQAPTLGNAAIVRFAMSGANVAETLYATVGGNETGGEIPVAGGCVYWIDRGHIWVIPTAPTTERTSALATDINDTVGLASDSNNLYFSRDNGEIWQRPLSPPACDGSGSPERRVAWGFSGIGDIVVYDGTLAWTADNYAQANSAGVFTTPIGGDVITQVAPGDSPPDRLVAAPSGVDALVFSTKTGRIRTVPKQPQ